MYAAVVQSSGYGKSRLLLEAGRHHFNTVYGNASESDSGFPKPNHDLVSFLRNNNKEEVLIRFLASCYKVAFDVVSLHGRRPDGSLPLFGEQGESCLFGSFWTKVIDLFKDAEASSAAVQFFQEQQDLFNEYRKVRPVNGLTTVVLADKSKRQFLPHLVVVFDEAKVLLKGDEFSIFRNMRRALKELNSFNMLLIFTDTLSSISNFAPPLVMHSSLRPDASKLFLFQPFYEVLTYDALSTDVNADPVNFSQLRSLLLQGRPLWAAFYCGRADKLRDLNAITELLRFAKRKLVFHNDGILLLPAEEYEDVSVMERKRRYYATIAVLAVRFGIDGVLDHTLASELMSSFMGTGTLY